MGREHELAEITAALDRAADEQPSMLLITGDAGLGKTTMVREALRRASAKGFATIVGAAAPGARGLAFGPVRAALRDLPALCGPDVLDAALLHRPAVLPLLPGAPAISAASAERADLYVDLLAFLGELSEQQPLVMALEDLHWADYSTLELLDFLARNLAGERLVLLATVRTDEPDADEYATRTLAELGRLQDVRAVQLSGLSRDDLARLVVGERGIVPTPAVIEDLAARVDGNPFFAVELLRADAETAALPKSIRDALGLRLGQLSDRDRQHLRAAAVVGQEVDPELIAAFLGRSVEEVEEACRAARQAEVLVVDPVDGVLRFRHGLYREQAYSELMAGERRRLHDRLADHLVADPGTPPAVLAYHYEGAGRLAEALVHTLRAARTAARARGSLDAIRHYRRTVELWPAVPDAVTVTGAGLVEVLEEASACSLNVGVTEQAAPFLETLLDELDPAAAPEQWAMTAAVLSEVRWEMGQTDEAFQLLDRADERLQGRPASPARVRLLERRSYQAFDTGQLQAAERAGIEAVAVATEVADAELQAVALGRLGLAHVTLGDVEGLDELRASLQLARSLGPCHEAAREAINLLAVLHAAGDMEAAEQTAQELLASIDRIAVGPDDRALIVALRARIATARGEFHRAADELAGTVVPTTLRYREYLTLAEAELAVATGDFGRAAERLESTATTDALLPGLHRAVVAAELAVRSGEPAVAREIVGSKLELAESYPEVTHLRLCALALESMEDDDPVADEYLARAERKYGALARNPVIAAPALDALVEAVRLQHALLRHLPPPPSAEAGIRAADQVGLRLLAGWSRLQLARSLVESGSDRAHAGRLAAEVYAWASAAGSGPLRSATEDLVRRARLDVGVVARPTEGDLGLTDRETEVLKLVAAGRTNREVAAQLYISPKTASVHVSNILRKVGAANRGEAAAVAHRRGLVSAP